MSTEAFPGLGARLSRYSYLVSMLPEQIIRDLDLPVELRSRRTASYSPTVRDGRHVGLFVEHEEGDVTRESFRALTGGDEEYAAWRDFYDEVGRLAEVVAPTLTRPAPAGPDLRDQVDPELWDAIVERPLGEVVEKRFTDDLVRGIVATDALIGTFADLSDPSLIQNRCFLYHLIGNGTGEWRVPVGGMGAVTSAMLRRATERGAEIRHRRRRQQHPRRHGRRRGHLERRTAGTLGAARHVLANVAPWVLRILLGDSEARDLKPAGLAAQDQLPAVPAAAAEEWSRPRGGVRRHVPRGRGVLRARAVVSRGLRRIDPDRPAGRVLLPLAHRPLDPGRPGRAGRAHAHLLRPAHARGTVRHRPGRAAR